MGNGTWAPTYCRSWILIQETSQERVMSRNLNFDFGCEVSDRHFPLWIQCPYL